MYNLTLKDQDDNNVVFQATQSATGVSPAVWVHSADVPALSQVLSLQIRDNGPKTARRVRITLQIPSFNALCEDSCELHVVPATIEFVVPKVVDRGMTKDLVHYLAALFANSDFRDSLVSGYAPA